MDAGAPPQLPPHGPPAGPARPFDPKLTGIVFAGASLAILIGVFTKAWATGRAFGVGLISAEACFGSLCRSASLSDLRVDGDIIAFGYLALIGGVAAAIIAALCALFLLTLKRDKLPKFKLANLVLLGGAGAMALFAVRVLFEAQTTIGWSPLFGLGGVIVASVFLRKLKAAWPDGATVPMSWGTAPHHGPPAGTPPAFGAPAQPPPAQPPAFGAPAQPPAFGAPPQPPPAPSPAFGAPAQSPAFGAPAQPPPAQPAQATAGCPRCGAAPLTFVAQYQRWFCERCRQYA